MITFNKFLKVAAVASLLIGMAGYARAADDSAKNGTSTKTETTQTNLGTITTTTIESNTEPKPTTSTSSATNSSSTNTATGGTDSADKAKNTAKDKTKKEKIDVNYSGLVNGRQVIPNTMAIFCKTNAIDMVKDTGKLYDCINKMVKKIKNKDSLVRQDGLKDWDEIRAEELRSMMAQAVAKGATIANYEEIQNSTGKAVSQTKTEHEDNVAIANTISISTDVMNTMRDLYAERLKYEAISGIKDIELSALGAGNDTDGTAEEGAAGTTVAGNAASGGGAMSSSEIKVSSTTTDEKTTESESSESLCVDENLKKISGVTLKVTSSGNVACSDGGKEVACQDGIYPNGDGTFIACKGGTCASCIEEVVVTPDDTQGKSEPNLDLDSDENPNASIPCEAGLKEVSGYKMLSVSTDKAICSNGSKQVACPDGKYKNGDGTYACKGGKCTGCVDNVEVIGSKVKECPKDAKEVTGQSASFKLSDDESTWQVVCKDGTKSVSCPDGLYPNGSKMYICTGGNCKACTK